MKMSNKLVEKRNTSVNCNQATPKSVIMFTFTPVEPVDKIGTVRLVITERFHW